MERLRIWAKPLSLAAVILALWQTPGQAQSFDWAASGFGTLAYAVTDSKEKFMGFLNRDGTFRSDSIAGAQIDGSLPTDWGVFGATAQVVGKANDSKNTGEQAKLSWAFLSYRPDNDWLFRLGKYRPPIFIQSQNMEVGTTYDVARLPVDVYEVSPIYDLTGASASKTWSFARSELNMELFWGVNDVYLRDYNTVTQSSIFAKYGMDALGTHVSYQDDDFLLRSSATRIGAKEKQPLGPSVPMKMRHFPAGSLASRA